MTSALALAALCAAQAPVPTPAPPTFRIEAEAVELDVSVTLGDRPVTGLTAADFVVRDNGVVQDVELATAGSLPLKLILSLDTSASMAGERLGRLRSGAGALLGDLREGDRAALVSFSHRVRVLEGLSHDVAAVRGRLEVVAADGMTALNDALYTSLALADGAAGRCALVLFSDGLDNISWTTEADVLDSARASPAVVYVVASSLAKPRDEERKHVARDPRESFLRKLTDATGGKIVKADDDADLVEAFGRVLPELRSRYVLRYAPQGVPGAGWHPIEVKLKGRKGELKARPGYLKAASER
jgi:VWFA-related protein